MHHLFIILLAALPSVLSEGYPKETPDTPFITGSAGGSHNNAPPGGYPPVSMDYNSRYRGPVAMLMVLPDGHIAETAEVTAARAAHLAALDKAKALWSQAGAGGGQAGGSAGGNGGYSYPSPDSNSLGGGSTGGDGGYSYPSPNSNSLGAGSAGGDGGYNYPSPTSNSLAGGSAVGQSYLPPQGNTGGSIQGQGTTGAAVAMPYDGPLAMPMVLPDGHIADTPEVTAAREAHLAALDKAKSSSGHASAAGGSAGGDGGYSYPKPVANSLEGGSSGGQSYLPPQVNSAGASGQVQGTSSSAAASDMSYGGPQAMLMVLPSGYLADTPDIAALRAAHLAALLKAQAAWKPQDGKQH